MHPKMAGAAPVAAIRWDYTALLMASGTNLD